MIPAKLLLSAGIPRYLTGSTPSASVDEIEVGVARTTPHNNGITCNVTTVWGKNPPAAAPLLAGLRCLQGSNMDYFLNLSFARA